MRMADDGKDRNCLRGGPPHWKSETYLKEQYHEDFAVLGQFCAKIFTLSL